MTGEHVELERLFYDVLGSPASEGNEADEVDIGKGQDKGKGTAHGKNKDQGNGKSERSRSRSGSRSRSVENAVSARLDAETALRISRVQALAADKAETAAETFATAARVQVFLRKNELKAAHTAERIASKRWYSRRCAVRASGGRCCD